MRYNKSIRGKLYRYFMQRLDLKESTKGYIRGNCPYCGSNFTFGINVEYRKVNCFKECGFDTDPIKVLMFLEGFQELKEVHNFLSIQQEYDSYNPTQSNKPREVVELKLPEEYVPIMLGDSILSKAARNYLQGRGFKLSTLMLQGVGYCLQGEYEGYIIFPFYEQGKLTFFQGRRFAGSGPKMKNPPEETFGIGKTQVIYNQDALFMYDEIRLVESITNALTLGETAIASLGKKLSRNQITRIIKSPCERITILLDPDAIKESIMLAMELSNYKKVRLVYWEGNEDVNDLGKKETLKRIKDFTFERYSYYNKLRLNPPQLTA